MGVPAKVTLDAGGLRLTPIIPADHPFLYDLAMSEENLVLWRYRGSVPPPEQFVAQLYADVLVQFLVRLESGEPVGMVVAYAPNLQSRHVHLGAVMSRQAQGRMIGAMAMEIFIQYLFDVWDFHGIFAEVPEFTQNAMMKRHAERNPYLPFEETGRRPKFYYFRGQYWDDCLTYLSREAWDNRTGSLVREAEERRGEVGFTR
jgi:RimJ/RimL family protein N-acetyltransferase